MRARSSHKKKPLATTDAPSSTRMAQTLTVGQSWAVLSVAILFEVAGTTCMRLSESFSRLVPSVLIFVFYAISFALNTLVMRTLGLSVVYAVWSGVGTVLTAIIGFMYFKEPATALKMMSAGLIVIGVWGMHVASRATG
jgi:small multidrug resistance pump